MKIVLEHLTKKFPARGKKGEEVTAVSDFTFEIPDGSLIGLLGPSGCGKSTALKPALRPGSSHRGQDLSSGTPM